MKRLWLVLISLSVGLYLPAQTEFPTTLLHATQCLVAKRILIPPKRGSLDLGYTIDTKSYPGEKVLYLVEYTKEHSEGFVFTVFLSSKHGQEGFNIQNNAKFRTSRDGFEGVDFVQDPLGGIWTQEHIVSAIKQIAKQPTVTVATKDLSVPHAGVNCEAYTDHPEKVTSQK